MLLVVGSHSVLVYVVCKLHVHQDIGDSCTWKECLLRMPLLLRLQLRETLSAPRKDLTTKGAAAAQVGSLASWGSFFVALLSRGTVEHPF